MEDNILNPNLIDEEDYQEVSLRPKKLNEYIGQNKVKESMSINLFGDHNKMVGRINPAVMTCFPCFARNLKKVSVIGILQSLRQFTGGP